MSIYYCRSIIQSYCSCGTHLTCQILSGISLGGLWSRPHGTHMPLSSRLRLIYILSASDSYQKQRSVNILTPGAKAPVCGQTSRALFSLQQRNISVFFFKKRCTSQHPQDDKVALRFPKQGSYCKTRIMFPIPLA